VVASSPIRIHALSSNINNSNSIMNTNTKDDHDSATSTSATTASYRTAVSSMSKFSSSSSSENSGGMNSSEIIKDVANSEDTGWSGKLVVRILPREYEDYGNVNLSKLHPFRVDMDMNMDLNLDIPSSVAAAADNRMKETTRTKISASVSSDFNFDSIIPTADLKGEDLVLSIDLDIHHRNPNENANKDMNMNKRANDEDQAQAQAQAESIAQMKSGSIHIHMNRSAMEEAHRTMARLELSTTKKITSTLFPSSLQKGKGMMSRKKQKKLAAAAASSKTNHGNGNGNASSSSSRIFLRSNDNKNSDEVSPDTSKIITTDANADKTVDMDTATGTALELFQSLSTKHDHEYRPNRIGLALTIPTPPSPISPALPTASTTTTTTNANSNETTNANELELEVQVTTNPPTIISISTFEMFTSQLYTSVPIVIQTGLIHADRAIVSWYAITSDNANSTNANTNTNINANTNMEHLDLELELLAYDSHTFIPQARHVGKRLLVSVTPFRKGYYGPCFREVYQFQNIMTSLPYMPIVSPLRDEFTITATSESNEKVEEEREKRRRNRILRVVTYNVLADLYVSRDESITTAGSDNAGAKGASTSDVNAHTHDEPHRVYPHVKAIHLKKTRRIPMIVAELLAYDADIICLQEVDGGVYDTFYYPAMRALGYDGFYSNKASCQREGCAMFWREDMFEGEECLTFSIRDLFDGIDKDDEDMEMMTYDDTGVGGDDGTQKHLTESPCSWDSMDDIRHLLRNHKELRKVTMEKIGQVLQIAKLKFKHPNDDDGEHIENIVVANTHLFYHPKADHIRAMQAYVVCKKIDEVRRPKVRDDIGCATTSSNPHSQEDYDHCYPIIICGDLNSDPLSGASQLLFTRSVGPAHHDCWKYLNEYQWEMGNTDYLTKHQYIGNDVGATDLAYEEEKFCDARQDKANGDNDGINSNPNQSITPPSLTLPESFPNLVSGCKEMPKFTNYAVDFIDTLDYILASEPDEMGNHGLIPKRSARMPTADEVKQFIAMPNEFMPSDHVSIVCDFEWKRR